MTRYEDDDPRWVEDPIDDRIEDLERRVEELESHFVRSDAPVTQGEDGKGMHAHRTRADVVYARQFTGSSNDPIDGVVVSPVLEPTPDNPTGVYGQLRGGGTCVVGDYVMRGRRIDGGARLIVVPRDLFEMLFNPDL